MKHLLLIGLSLLAIDGFAGPILYAIDNENPFLNRVNPITGAEEAFLEISVPGEEIVQSNGLAVNPLTNEMYAAVALEGAPRPGRHLIRIDIETGIGTIIGNMGEPIAGLAFSDTGVLYAVSGDCLNNCQATAETLFTVDLNDGSLTLVQALGNGDEGEAIAFNPNDGLIYHMSGRGAGLIFEKVDPVTHIVTPIPLSGDPVGPFETIGLTFDATQNLFVGSLIDCLCDSDDRSYFKLTAEGLLRHVNTLPFWWKDYAFRDEPDLHLTALPDVNNNGTVEAVAVVADRFTGSVPPGIHFFVRDTGTGQSISTRRVFNDSWRAIDVAVTPNGLIGVLAHRTSGTVRMALHRATTGQRIRYITFFNSDWIPAALAYVPDAEGPGQHAFAVVAENRHDHRVSVQLRRRGDGSAINTNKYFGNIWQAIALQTIDDISGNGRPEIVVLARSDAGVNSVLIKDALSRQVVARIRYFGKVVTPEAMTSIGDVGGSAAVELPVLGLNSNTGVEIAQSRDAATGALVSNIETFGGIWTPIDIAGLDDVNGNSAADLAVLAQHITNHTIRVQVRDASTGALIRSMAFLSQGWHAGAFAAFDDVNGNGVQELGVLGYSSGSVRAQLRDALTGRAVRTFNIQ